MKKIISFFKKLFFKQKNVQQTIYNILDIYDNIIDYQGYNLDAPMLDQIVTSKKLEDKVSDFVSDVIILFLKRYFIKTDNKYNYLIFIPSITVLNYIYDCFNHVINNRKYKQILRFNIIAKNEIFTVILNILNRWIYNLEEDEDQE